MRWIFQEYERKEMGRQRQYLLFIFALAAIVFQWAIRQRLGVQIADDGAFFLRYAENMAHGSFWVWNRGEPPVWGASAPLFPLLIAIPIALGLPPVAAMVWTCVILSTAALSAAAVLLAKRFGLASGIAFIALSSLDSGLMFFSGSGLETPLTIALLVFAMYVLLEHKSDFWVGVAAGLLAVNKLDLIPVTGLVCLAHAYAERRIVVRAILVAALIMGAWYGFAWFYFGFPLPNSFLTKALHQNNMVFLIDWHWFYQTVFVRSGHSFLCAFALLGIWKCQKQARPFLVLTIGLLVIHTTAYTIKYPFEPYEWYCMPALFTLIVLASAGFGKLYDLTEIVAPQPKQIAYVVPMLAVAALVYARYDSQIAETRVRLMWSNTIEVDRSDAGLWVAKHTPGDFRVATAWGNTATFSDRYVYDLAYLNRRPDPGGNAIALFKPEILIMENPPAATPISPQSYGNYVPVKVFDRTFAVGETNFFYTVYARKDVVSKLTGVTFPILTSCMSKDACEKYHASPMVELKPASLESPNNTARTSVCSIDNASVENGVLKLRGWGAIELPGASVVNSATLSVPTGATVRISRFGQMPVYAPVRVGLGRADVAISMKLPESMNNMGFDSNIDATKLAPGDYRVDVLLRNKSTTQNCAPVPIHIGASL